MVYFVLLIWIRNDYGKSDPSLAIAARSKAEVSAKFLTYLYEHRTEENHMDDDEFYSFANEIAQSFDRGPELNCAYELHLMEAI